MLIFGFLSFRVRNLNYEKFQIIPTKYPKHVENDYGIFRGVTIINTKSFLRSKFDMKDLGEAKVILGIKITRTLNGLNLSQEHYIEKILKRFEHFGCKPLLTPNDPSSQLKKNRKHSVAQTDSQSPNQDHWVAIVEY